MATRKKYKDVEDALEMLNPCFFDDTLFAVKSKLTDLAEKYSDHVDLRIDVYEDYDTTAITLYGTRSETDTERHRRLGKAKTAREKKAEKAAAMVEKEKNEFFRLHEKFGHLL